MPTWMFSVRTRRRPGSAEGGSMLVMPVFSSSTLCGWRRGIGTDGSRCSAQTKGADSGRPLLLSRTLLRFDHHVEDAFGHAGLRRVQQRRDVEACAHDRVFVRERLEAEFAVQIGRASCRERVCQYV